MRHGVASGSALALLGVDWGLDCLLQELEMCNGDNRDAQYIMAFPPARLDRPGQVLLVVGAWRRSCCREPDTCLASWGAAAPPCPAPGLQRPGAGTALSPACDVRPPCGGGT